MKKKYFSTLLMGLLVLGTTGTVTSCKDYDDDINGLQTQVNDLNTALKSCQSECQANLASLKSQIEAQNATINQLKAEKANESDLAAAVARVASLEAKASTLEAAIKEINSALDGKVDKADYDKTVSDIYAKLQSVETDLGAELEKVKKDLNSLEQVVANVQADLEQQTKALDAYKAEMEKQLGAISADLAQKIADAKADLEKQIAKCATAESVEALKAIVDGNVAKIEALQTEINVLNVLVNSALRSLVFVPDAYYYGIEATSIKALDYFKFNVPATAWDKTEAKGYDNHVRYDSTAASRVLTFVANYHMNPSSANAKDFGKMTVLTDDKEYIVDTRAAASAPFTVAGYTAENGVLSANIKVNDPSKIKTVGENNAVTVFALQVNTNKEGKDTTITSDYATVYKKTVKDLKLYHTAGDGVPFTGVKNEHDPSPALTGADADHVHGNVLMQTAGEAKTFAAQDTVVYDGELDLNKLVEVHYTDVAGNTSLMTAAEMEANGLSYKFELTGLYIGQNNTSESAHAAIKDATLRPQMPNKDGQQQAYGAEQARQEIGRTPLVRVELVDAEGAVVDYGYIRVVIVDKAPEVKPDLSVSYTGDGWTYNGECNPKLWNIKTKWNQTVYDLYTLLNVTRDEFLNNYKVVQGSDGDLVQYVLAENGKYVEAENAIGSIIEHEEATAESGTKTQVFEWSISGDKMKSIFVTEDNKLNEKATASRAIKYASKDKTVGPDVYVVFNVGTPITVTLPKAVANLDANKIEKMWYAANTSEAGKDEVHTNTLTPEDNAGKTAEALDNTFSDLFTGNLKAASAYIMNITDVLPGNTDYAASDMKLDFMFARANEGRTAKGIFNGDTVNYVLTVINGKELGAFRYGQRKETAEVIARITGDDATTQKVEYVHNNNNNGISEALLNYKAHNKLADDVLNVTIGMFAQNKCGKNVPLTENKFDVRFLRPLNVFNSNKEIEDAANALQTINVENLVLFTDWRDLWDGKQEAGKYTAIKVGSATFTTGYTKYYDIEAITIPGVADGQNLAVNARVKTNLNGKEQSLSAVSDQVEFTYNKGVITYKNLSSNVREFYVKVPVQVAYIWGTVSQDVTITVKKSLNNAKKN